MGRQPRARATRVSRRPSVQPGVQAPGARRRWRVPRPAIRSSSTPSPWCRGSGRFSEDAGICLGLQAACGLIVSIELAPAARSRCQPRPSPGSMTGTGSAAPSGQRGRLVCVLTLRDRSSRQRARRIRLTGRIPSVRSAQGAQNGIFCRVGHLLANARRSSAAQNCSAWSRQK